MRTRNEFIFKIPKSLFLGFLLVFSFSSCSSLPPDIKNQVLISQNMIINECACGEATALVDEQSTYSVGFPISYWKLDKCRSTVSLPSAVIDLGAEFELTTIHFFDSYGTGLFEINYGTPFQWTNLLKDSLNHFQYWNTKTVKIKTRFLQLKSKDWMFPAEILLEGKRITDTQIKKSISKTIPPLFGEFIGTNAFVDDPVGLLSPFGTIREYHPWFAWNQATQGNICFNPTEQGFNFDLYYNNLKNLGIAVSPVLQQSPKWLTNDVNSEVKPIQPGKNSYNPASYLEHAQFIFQYAARYGNGNVQNGQLLLIENQERKANLNILKYFENWNEQDKWWRGKDSYFTPYEYAAMSSADLDGHLNTLGKNVGIANADPKAKLVMGGLANPNIDYVKALKLWSDFNRKGDFPWKAINLHHYSNDGGGQFQSKIGISPEEDHLKEKLEVFTKYRDSLLPGVEVWLSEFGYDCKDDSPQRSPAIGGMNNEEVQAAWVVRAYLAASAAGIDRAFQYMIRDTDGKGLYMSSGLYYWKKEGDQKEAVLRPSWYYLATLQKLLAKYRFESEITSKIEGTNIYSFTSENKSSGKIYAIWCTSSTDKKIADYKFTVPSGYKNYWKVSLEDKKSNGKASKLNIQNSTVELEVTEKPVFIVVSNDDNFSLPTEDKLLKLNPSMIVNESVGKSENLADEQDIFGDPDKGIFKIKPKTSWDVAYNQTLPANVYIDLGKEYLVTKLYLFDGPSFGKLIISTGKPGNWQKADEDNLYNYNSWKAHVLGVKTRYIRLSRTNASSGIFELAVYVQD